MSYSDLIRSDRTPGQRAQDDEDHRQALCGLSFDARAEEEVQDFYSRHYDFNIFGGPQVCSSGLIAANWPRASAMGSSRLTIRESDTGGKTRLSGRPSNTFALAPQARSRGQGTLGGAPPPALQRSLAPPPF